MNKLREFFSFKGIKLKIFLPVMTLVVFLCAMFMLLMNHEIRNVVLAGQMDSLKAQSVIGSAMAELSPVIIIALLISAFLCMGISTYFSIAIKNVLLTIGELRKNHLSARTDNRSKDEIGQMSRELDGFADNLKINVLGVMQRIAAGNTSDLDLKCEDPYDEVIPVMISTVETLRDITGDTKSIIAAAEAGDLTQRCRAEIYRGSWADLAGEINNLMDSISRPVHEVCENINKISVFDFTSQVTGNYEGLFKEMAEDTNNLCMRLRGIQHALDMVSNGDTSIRGNYEKIGKRSDNDQMMPTIIRMFENIENMICETKNLSENSVNGNIDIRGDISKFSGGYKEVIEGFNNTLDAVAAPITEMHEVLDAMAVNDYTLSVSEGYKGEYDKLANAINDVRSRLLTVQNVAIKISEGDTSELEVLKPIGRRSENDRILPALIKMMENINLLIKETTAIADSAAEGKLDIRGDADQFGGGYRNIVQSINAFLDAVEAPVGEITDVMGSVETGVLDCRITSDYQGKFKELADAVNHTVMQLMSIIQEMNHALTEISKGNLSMSAVREYEGDYHPLSVATNLILDSLNDLLSKIDIDSQQVREGASELSEASQNLAQGATEQASSVEELSASIAEIASETRQNAENSKSARNLVSKIKEQADIGGDRMNKVLSSMNDIQASSTNISTIIKTIDAIAFQTNILALNAAVEAARAGQAGKGFAVVADEVRSLAQRSAVAAKETAEFIEDTANKVNDGMITTDEAAKSFLNITQGVDHASGLIDEIAKASNEQATGLAQINQAVDQVSKVIQTNSAISEESAASSEQLSGQASMLSNLVSRFQLRSETVSELPENSKPKDKKPIIRLDKYLA